MNRKVKIAFVVEAMLGGIRQHVCDIIQNLSREKYEIYLIYSDLRADDGFYREKEKLEKTAKLILLNDMQRSLGKKDLTACWKLVKILKDINPDIVHCHSSKAGIIGRMAAKICRIPVILYTPNAYAFQNPNISPLKRKIYILAERILTKNATTMTINVSKGEMRLAQKYKLAGKENFVLIYNGIPDTGFSQKEVIRKELGLDLNKIYIGVTARCAEQKSPMTFLKIAEKILKKHDDVEFVYIGDGELKAAMEKWIADKKLQSKIHMPGFCLDAARIVGMFDIYLSTALYEGLPYSMIEAMRAGVPIIATDVVGNNELVFAGKNGMLFPAGEVEAACELIERQIKEHFISEEKVKETFMQKFSVNTMMHKLNEVYTKQIGGGYKEKVTLFPVAAGKVAA